jgi:hypothetical protein
LRSDHRIGRPASAQKYPGALRRIRYIDPERCLRLVKSRWQIELFFRRIKQHLRIRAFFGTSANAVKTQIWIAMSVYVLAAIVRKRLGLEVSLYSFLQVLGVTMFEKTPIFQLFQQSRDDSDRFTPANQLTLLDF